MTLRNGCLDGNVAPVPSTLNGDIVSEIADYTVTLNVGTVLVDATLGPVRVSFLPAVGNVKQKITVEKTDATVNAVTVWNGLAVVATMQNQHESFDIQSTGTALVVS